MDQNLLLKIPGNPAALAEPEDVNHSAPTKTADTLNTSLKICLEEIMDKLLLKPNSGRFQIPKKIQICPKKSSDIQIQHGDKKGKMWLSDLLTNITFLSRTMELEKFKNRTSIGSGNLLGISINNCRKTAWLPIKNEKTYQDWRGVILPERITPYTMLTDEEHQERLKRITKRKRFGEKRQSLKLEEDVLDSKKNRRKSRRRTVTIVHEKVRRIGPHLDIFEAFSQMRKIPSQKTAVTAAISIQKIIRGYLERSRFNRIKLKAQYHGTTLAEVVKEYRKMMCRIKRRCGYLDLSTPLIYEQLEDWLDQKKFYETVFTKREYWKEMDVNELPKFFKDCGLFPPQKELNIAVQMVLREAESKVVCIKKHQAIEMAFMLYPPTGLNLKTAATARSTWLRPIVDGEDGYKYIVAGHPVVKGADIRIAGDLVATSMRQWKVRNHYCPHLDGPR
ncbi:IQ domain-containing protein M isoform X2 [Paroedura picta]|uniref:IQ domain-containing protein M isoform X2 n=1 Tax=Paroedura picta TaxID=143630 RepID=UPI004055CE27